MTNSVSKPQQADNLFYFLSRVLHDEEFKQAFNQSTAEFLTEQGLDDAQVQAVIDIHTIIYMKGISDEERAAKLQDKWQTIISAYKDDYATYLTDNFSW